VPDANRDRLVDSLSGEVAKARLEFDRAKAQLSAACKIVPDIDHASPDGALLWERATTRYKRAEQAYGNVLKRFAEVVHNLSRL